MGVQEAPNFGFTALLSLAPLAVEQVQMAVESKQRTERLRFQALRAS